MIRSDSAFHSKNSPYNDAVPSENCEHVCKSDAPTIIVPAYNDPVSSDAPTIIAAGVVTFPPSLSKPTMIRSYPTPLSSLSATFQPYNDPVPSDAPTIVVRHLASLQ